MVKKANSHASVMQTGGGGRTGWRTDLQSLSEFDWSKKIEELEVGQGRKEVGWGGKKMILALATFSRLRFIKQSDYFRTACLPANSLTSSLFCQCTSKRKTNSLKWSTIHHTTGSGHTPCLNYFSGINSGRTRYLNVIIMTSYNKSVLKGWCTFHCLS